MKKVITYGTFDLLHWGHIKLLERAKQLGDYLVVAISTDEFNLQKQKKAYHSYEHRKLILETIRYVDEVIPEKNWEQKSKILLIIILMFLLWGMTGKVNLTFSKISVRLFTSQEQKASLQQRSKRKLLVYNLGS